jgi:hypothetical protein
MAARFGLSCHDRARFMALTFNCGFFSLSLAGTMHQNYVSPLGIETFLANTLR